MKRKRAIICAIFSTIITAAFSFVVWKVDVRVLGQTNTPVGLASINELMIRSYNELCDKSSIILGYVVFLVLGIMAMLGFVQLIQRRSLLKVDKKIIGAGILFVVTLMLYVLFSKVSINYRPVILPGEEELELSYPSSHAMMAVVTCGAALHMLGDYIKNSKIMALVKVMLYLIIASMVVLRYLSGAHWFTDIIGGILIGMSLLLWYIVSVESKEIYIAKH